MEKKILIKQLKLAQKCYYGFGALALLIAFVIMVLAPLTLTGNVFRFFWGIGTGLTMAFFFLYAIGTFFWCIEKIEAKKVIA